jgi:hypothetical protein
MTAELVRNTELAQHLCFQFQLLIARLVADEDLRTLTLKQLRNCNAAAGGTNDTDLSVPEL